MLLAVKLNLKRVDTRGVDGSWAASTAFRTPDIELKQRICAPAWKGFTTSTRHHCYVQCFALLSSCVASVVQTLHRRSTVAQYSCVPLRRRLLPALLPTWAGLEQRNQSIAILLHGVRNSICTTALPGAIDLGRRRCAPTARFPRSSLFPSPWTGERLPYTSLRSGSIERFWDRPA